MAHWLLRGYDLILIGDFLQEHTQFFFPYGCSGGGIREDGGGVLGSNLHFTHFHCSVQGFNLILNILKVFNDMDEISPDC